MAQGFRGPQVCKIVGISYRQLDHWDRTGLLRPSLAPAKGSGTQRLYSYQDVVQLRIIKQLREAGVSLQQARKAVEFLRDSGSDLASASLVLGANNSVLARDGDELLDVLRGGQGVFNVVALGGLVGEVDAAILELSPEQAPRKEQDEASQAAGGPLEHASAPGAGRVRPSSLAQGG